MRIRSLAAFVGVAVLLVPSEAVVARPVTVNVAGDVSGPSGVVDLQSRADGDGTLVGTGTGVHRDLASQASFDLTGTVDGDLVQLSGTVRRAGAACLVGTPVTVDADVSTGQISHTLGPIGCPGPANGQTLTFSGAGTVVLTH